MVELIVCWQESRRTLSLYNLSNRGVAFDFAVCAQLFVFDTRVR